MKTQTYIILAVVVILVAAGSFFGGMKYQQSQRGNRMGQFNGQNFMGRFNQNGMGQNNFRPVRGEVTSADDKSITVKMADGSSKIVILSDSTAITEATSATKQALKSGTQVMIFGNQNSDGSVTAQNIQLNPQLGRMDISNPQR